MAEIFTRAQMDAIVATCGALIEKFKRETPMVSYQPGTVTTYEQQTGGIPAKATVQMDGDDPDDAIPCPVLIPHPLSAGDRVMVAFSPPHAHLVTGVLLGGESPFGRFTSDEDSVDFLGVTCYAPLGVPQGRLAAGMEYESREWDSELMEAFIVPRRGVYSFSVTVQLRKTFPG